jgi:hypothetical protein
MPTGSARDCYAHDAMATVRYADKLFEKEA